MSVINQFYRILFIFFIIHMFYSVPEITSQKRPNKDKKEFRDKRMGKDRLRDAVHYYEKEDFTTAHHLLKSIIKDEPDNAFALTLAGIVSHRINRPDEARKFIKRALELKPKSKSVNLTAAFILYKDQKTLKAHQLLQTASKLQYQEKEMVLFTDEQIRELSTQISGKISEHKKESVRFYEEDHSQQTQKDDAGLPVLDNSRRLKIAVLSFEINNLKAGNDTLRPQNAAAVSEMLITALVKTRCYQVAERQQVSKIIQEQDFEMTDIIDNETAVKAGELMGVDAVVMGTLSKMTGKTEIDCRLVSVKTGEINTAHNTSYSGDEDLRNALTDLARKIAKDSYK